MNKAPIGCLILHGLSSNINCVDAVVPRLEKHNIPYRMPYLRGHGTKPEDLVGVKWQDWYADAEKAFKDLLNVADKVLVIALSMGSLPGMDLTIAYQDKIAGIVTLVSALRLATPLEPFVPVIGLIQKKVVFKDVPADWDDPEQLKTNLNYKWIPSTAVMEMVRYYKRMRKPEMVGQIKVPALVISTTRDHVIDPRTSQWLYDKLGSSDKTIKWFHKTSHEILRDGEREQILDEIEAFVVRLNDTAISQAGQKQQI